MRSSAESKPRTGLAMYQSGLAAIAVLAVFSHLHLYIFDRTEIIAPLYWYGAIGVLAFPIGIKYLARLAIPGPRVVLFALCYFLLVFTGWLIADQGPITHQAFKNAMLSVLLLFVMAILFSTQSSVTLARKAVMVVVIAAVGINVYEVFFAGAFSTIPGRSAGFYINPNGAAISLILGTIVGIHVVPAKWREILVVVVGIGVAVTFSRAGLIVWTIMACLFLLFAFISIRRLGIVLAIFTVAGAAAIFVTDHILFDLMSDVISLNPDVDSRIQFFSSLLREDFSVEERQSLVALGWRMFTEHPFLGAGIGATQTQAVGVVGREAGTHNMYLTLMAEHGIAGFFVIPLMTLLAAWGAYGNERKTAIVFAVVILVWALFDHNLLDTPSKLMMFSIQCAAVSLSGKMQQKTQSAPARAVMPVAVFPR